MTVIEIINKHIEKYTELIDESMEDGFNSFNDIYSSNVAALINLRDDLQRLNLLK